MSVMKKFLISLIVIFSFSMISFAQEVETDEPSDVIVPEQAMKQVVQRILVWSFKPQKQSKVIFLAEEGIQKSWLPSIKNIKFSLLSAKEVQQKEKGVYFFTKIDRTGNQFHIGFAFGNPNCEYTGDYWQFYISKQRVKIWQNGLVGSNCNS